jgi:hypothetical protein
MVFCKIKVKGYIYGYKEKYSTKEYELRNDFAIDGGGGVLTHKEKEHLCTEVHIDVFNMRQNRGEGGDLQGEGGTFNILYRSLGEIFNILQKSNSEHLKIVNTSPQQVIK